MNTKKFSKIAVGSIAILMGLTMAVSISLATIHDKESKTLDKISSEGNAAMRDLRRARVALFNGQPESAKKYLDSAKEELGTVEKQAPELVVTINSQRKIGDKTVATDKVTETSDYIPIDTWLMLSEDFVATPEKNASIKEANKHMQNGDKKKAIDVLKAYDIGVSESRMLMPVKATINNVDKAIAFMNEHKYYEANLSLKSAEGGLIVDSVLLDEPAASLNTDKALDKKVDSKTTPAPDGKKKD